MAETTAATNVPPVAPTAKPKKKRERKVGINGIAHVQSTFNNTIVTISDMDGHTVAWASAGKVGFKGSRKSTPFAAQIAAESATKEAVSLGLKKVEVWVKGPGVAPGGRARDLGHQGRHPDSTQRLSPAEAAARLTGRGGHRFDYGDVSRG